MDDRPGRVDSPASEMATGPRVTLALVFCLLVGAIQKEPEQLHVAKRPPHLSAVRSPALRAVDHRPAPPQRSMESILWVSTTTPSFVTTVLPAER